jgi:N-acetylglucosamine-6-phosphate deacetylase
MFQLDGKGSLARGDDADMVFLDKDLSIKSVMANGRFITNTG